LCKHFLQPISNNERGPLLSARFSSIPFIVFVYLFVASISFLGITHLTDPGLLPKKETPLESDEGR
jgi:hypothetical protein